MQDQFNSHPLTGFIGDEDEKNERDEKEDAMFE